MWAIYNLAVGLSAQPEPTLSVLWKLYKHSSFFENEKNDNIFFFFFSVMMFEGYNSFLQLDANLIEGEPYNPLARKNKDDW